MRGEHEQHLVSVVIPAHNAAAHLGDAVESVLAQTHDRIELIVVDDASTDDTAAVAARYAPSVRYVAQPHRGASAARNHGVRVSTGDFVAFLDADDLWEPDKLALQIAAFDGDPELEVVFGHVVNFWSPDVVEQAEGPLPDVSAPMRGDHPGTMLLPRTVFDSIGPFREDHVMGDFIDWYARALDGGRRMLMLEPVVMRRRLHRTNLGRSHADAPLQYARVLREVIHRRRGHA